MNSVAPTGTRVDEASFRALIEVKWCQAKDAQNNFYIKWEFQQKDSIALMTKISTEAGIPKVTYQKKWSMQEKTLSIREISSNVEIIKKDLSFAFDLNTGTRLMQWYQSAAETVTLVGCE